MGTHPIFESDFDCLTEKWLTKNSERSSFWLKSKNKIDQSQTGSDTVLVTPSSTTPRDDTGEEPRSVCKLFNPIKCPKMCIFLVSELFFLTELVFLTRNVFMKSSGIYNLHRKK